MVAEGQIRHLKCERDSERKRSSPLLSRGWGAHGKDLRVASSS
jgi:hypothetical protein